MASPGTLELGMHPAANDTKSADVTMSLAGKGAATTPLPSCGVEASH
jgi:hypothetical protein